MFLGSVLLLALHCKVLLVIFGVCFSILCEIFCGPVALLFILVRNVAVSWSVMSFVSMGFLSRLFMFTVVCGLMLSIFC